MPARAKSIAGKAAMQVQGPPAALQAVQAAYVIDTVAGGELAATASDGSRVIMRTAVSCLVAPLPGDRVLAAAVGGETFVLAVLERQGGARDVAIRIETAGDLDIVARRISLRAGVFDVLTDAVTIVGDALNTLFRRSKRIVGNETVVAQSTTLHAGQRVAVIAQADVQQAGVLSQTVAGPLAISSHTAVVTAKADIRLNGERINVG